MVYLRVPIPQSRGLHQLFLLTSTSGLTVLGMANVTAARHVPPWIQRIGVITATVTFLFLSSCATHVIIFLPVLFINLFVHYDNIKAKEGS